uniref:Chemokine interleukin-8-like domain-containing protein n=1 Tax=Neolamprologus brichardi TaxID=32507 RepID=A0A3Q4GGK3_NEOBR
AMPVSLLLVLVNSCFSVTAKAVNSPDFCCFRFFDKRIPKANIVSIVKTHRKCLTPAFEQFVKQIEEHLNQRHNQQLKHLS